MKVSSFSFKFNKALKTLRSPRKLLSSKLNPVQESSLNHKVPLDLYRFDNKPKKSYGYVESQESSVNTNVFDPNKLSESIVIVSNRASAEKVLEVLMSYPDVYWACDTEVADIDLKKVGPIGNGKVTCISIYGGPKIDFGSGPGGILWIETIDEAEGLLSVFANWFQDKRYKKVWHNYGFDRHVMFNEGIDCKGFAGDTMHMARLCDTSRDKLTGGGEGYSLESLSHDYLKNLNFSKTSMKELFGVSVRTNIDGSDSKLKKIPPVYDLQRNPEYRDKWIEYSARDAVATWFVHEKLSSMLKLVAWKIDSKWKGTMLEFYERYMVDFGELLTDMERNGILVDTKGHLKEAEKKAREEKLKMEEIFLTWASKYNDDAKYLNLGSTTQIQQLFFGYYEKGELVSTEKVFKIDKLEEEFIEEEKKVLESNKYVKLNSEELKTLLKARSLKTGGKKSDLIARLMEYDNDILSPQTKPENMSLTELQELCLARGLEYSDNREDMVQFLVEDALFQNGMAAAEKLKAERDANSKIQKVKKYREIKISTIQMQPLAFTPGGSPQVSAAILRKMAGTNLFGDEKDAVYAQNTLRFFGDIEAGKEACRAIGALANIGQIDSTITNFLEPLQRLVDKEGRIHCSLNLNTETGRLSSRRPNLQNQPALEKDQYKIRDAFIASPGNTLIVADYGQLELRLLAHITNCKSMLDAFAKGGCFHSRTAVGMYDYIREAVDTGKVLLEWDYSKGQPTVPLVKDTFGSERRKAKTLNFSIAYGKTVHGLAQDWGISKEEATATLNAWYADRPEVKEWQDNTIESAKKNCHVSTLMGRYRHLPDAQVRGSAGSHALRAAINTPIQGSAADVVMMAMIKIWKSERLRELGWKLLLQIHDEVILEGPKETMPDAMIEVRYCMENPFDNYGLYPLNVHLDVDAKSADSWYKAK